MKLLLIDALNVIRRVFEAGQNSSAQILKKEDFVRAAVASIQRGVREVQPSHAVCVFDSVGPTWRHTLYPEYKANREPPPPLFYTGCTDIRHILEKAGIYCFSLDGYEGDDIVASLAHKAKQRSILSVILSTDKDYSQLLCDLIIQYDHFANEYRTETWVEQHYGVPSRLFAEAQAFMGDSTDNIPGVFQIGRKKAAALLKRFGSLEKVVRMSDHIEGKQGIHIRRDLDKLKLSYSLVTLKTDISLGVNLKEFIYHPHP